MFVEAQKKKTINPFVSLPTFSLQDVSALSKNGKKEDFLDSYVVIKTV